MAQNEGHDSSLQSSETCFKRFIFLAEPHELKKIKMNSKMIIITKFETYIYVPDSVLHNLLVFLPFISSEKYMSRIRELDVHPVKFSRIRSGQLVQAVVIFL